MLVLVNIILDKFTVMQTGCACQRDLLSQCAELNITTTISDMFDYITSSKEVIKGCVFITAQVYQQVHQERTKKMHYFGVIADWLVKGGGVRGQGGPGKEKLSILITLV